MMKQLNLDAFTETEQAGSKDSPKVRPPQKISIQPAPSAPEPENKGKEYMTITCPECYQEQEVHRTWKSLPCVKCKKIITPRDLQVFGDYECDMCHKVSSYRELLKFPGTSRPLHCPKCNGGVEKMQLSL